MTLEKKNTQFNVLQDVLVGNVELFFFKVFYSINLMSVAGGDETMEHSLCKRGNRDAKFATPCSLHTFRQ